MRLSDGSLLDFITIADGYKWAMMKLAELVNENEKRNGIDKDLRSALAYLNLFYRIKTKI